MKFSERLGYRPPKLDMQLKEIDEALRNGLWDVLEGVYFTRIDGRQHGPRYSDDFRLTADRLWHKFFKEPRDTIPQFPYVCVAKIREWYFSHEFPDVYDLFEFLLKNGRTRVPEEDIRDFANAVLAREKAAFRVIGTEFVPISNEVEVSEVEEAINSPHLSVRTHVAQAVRLLSDRETPDFRNSIKESISAVEAAVRIVVEDPKATLGKALNVLGNRGEVHPALRQGFSSLYGYTNDADGIRHAILDEQEVTESDARYWLISCNAFANYLLSKQAYDGNSCPPPMAG